MSQLINKSIAGILCLALAVPHQALADSSADSAETQQPVIRDVELAEGGVARGYVVTSAGQPGAGLKVALHSQDKVYQATTDENGQFTVSGLQGGQCIVQVGQTVYGARFWATGTAPPQALKGFAIVDGDDSVVRGASEGSPNGIGYLNPLNGLSKKQLIGLGIGVGVAAATIAIILAIQDDGDASN